MLKRILPFLLLFFSSAVYGQFADSLKAQLIRDWTRSRSYTNEYLKTMPESKYSFRAQDSIRSFAQQMIHLAQGTISLISASTGKKVPDIINRPGLEQTPTAMLRDSVSFFVNLSYNITSARS